MKKKNLAILLLLPYLISLLGIITVNLTFKTFQNDISHIEWDYSDIEVFKLADTRYRLNATGVNTSNFPLAEGNELIWTVENQDGTENPYARIEKENGTFYLVPLAEGTVTLSCSNEKGNVTRRTTVIIYLNSVIVVRTAIQSSQNNIDPTIYYGEYDLVNGQKTPAKIELDILCVPDSLSRTLCVASKTDNVQVDAAAGIVQILGDGAASFTLRAGTQLDNTETSFSYSFNVVDNGVNVYTYDDLLNCTNRSAEGEIVVLRKSFESVQNTYQYSGSSLKLENGAPVKKANNVELFGTYDHSKDRYGFADEVYRFETTYNQSYIQQWNAFAKDDSYYREISNQINVGLHVQKDFYGNGYTLNLHNLTYPYDSIDGKDAETGEVIAVPYLRADNLFRGPLPFYTLGDPNGMPLVTAHGQDNIGMYVGGDNIKINDVNLKNCDFGNSFSNLEYVGTVLEVYGDNVTVQNSILQNGKNVMRAYSSQNTVLENCMLQNARNFLLMVGCNEYLPIDDTTPLTFKDSNGNNVTMTLSEYLAKNSVGDSDLLAYLLGSANAEQMAETLQSIQSALNTTTSNVPFGGSMEIKDCLFYRSGITSIALESFFNGPFLYNGAPSLVGTLFSSMTEEGGNRPLVPFIPQNVSGVSYPVDVNITGKTKFYDYKTMEDMDLTGLISENISTIAQSILDSMGKETNITITIDDIFPLKRMLYQTAAANGNVYNKDGKTYVNVPVAFYGGGLNLSEVHFDGYEDAQSLNAKMDVDWVESYLQMPSVGSTSNLLEVMPSIMQKTVTTVTGFEPFRFVCTKGNGYLFGATPNVADLRNNLKG